MPAIKFHWRAGYFRHSSGGSRFTASPRISIARSNARTVCHAESKLDKVLSLQIACACLAKSAIWLSVTSGLRLLINWQSLAPKFLFDVFVQPRTKVDFSAKDVAEFLLPAEICKANVRSGPQIHKHINIAALWVEVVSQY